MIDRDRLCHKRPVAADLDGVAIAGANHRVGQRVELALCDAFAAQDDEGLRLRTQDLLWQPSQPHRAVPTAGEKSVPVGRKGEALNLVLMTFKAMELFSSL